MSTAILKPIKKFTQIPLSTVAARRNRVLGPASSLDHDHHAPATVIPPDAATTTSGLHQRHSTRSPAVAVSGEQLVSRARIFKSSALHLFFNSARVAAVGVRATHVQPHDPAACSTSIQTLPRRIGNYWYVTVG